MQCTKCCKQFSNIGDASHWPLHTSDANIWPRASLPISQSAVNLLRTYPTLAHINPPIHALLTHLTRHVNVPTPATDRYEVGFYSASQLTSACQSVVERLPQTRILCDLQTSFVVCLKPGAAAVYCLSDFLGAATVANNSKIIGDMYANPMHNSVYIETNFRPSAAAQESSTDDPDYFVPMDASEEYYAPAKRNSPPTRGAAMQDWDSHYYTGAHQGQSGFESWPSIYYTAHSAQAPRLPRAIERETETQYAVPMAETQFGWGDGYDIGEGNGYGTPPSWHAGYYTSHTALNANGLYSALARDYEHFIVVFAYQATTTQTLLPILQKRSWRKPFYLVASVLAAVATIAAVVAVTRRGGGSTATTVAPTGLSFNPNMSAVGFQPCYPIPMAALPIPQVFNLTGMDSETQEVVAAMTNVTTQMVMCAVNAPLNISAPSFALSWPTASASWQRTMSANLTDIALQLMPQEILPWYFNLTSLCVWCSTDTALLLDAAIAQNQVRVPGNANTAEWSVELANQLCSDLLTCALAHQGNFPNGTAYGRLLNRTLNRFNPEFVNSTLVSLPGTRQSLPSFMYNLGLSIYTRMMEIAPSYVPATIMSTAMPANATTTTSRTATTVTATTRVTTMPMTEVATTTDTPSTLVLTTSTPTTTIITSTA
jgi:hypothetical protein